MKLEDEGLYINHCISRVLWPSIQLPLPLHLLRTRTRPVPYPIISWPLARYLSFSAPSRRSCFSALASAFSRFHLPGSKLAPICHGSVFLVDSELSPQPGK